MMKLFAFRDRKEDRDKNLGRHHALDLYAIVAMQVESEYQESLRWVTCTAETVTWRRPAKSSGAILPTPRVSV